MQGGKSNNHSLPGDIGADLNIYLFTFAVGCHIKIDQLVSIMRVLYNSSVSKMSNIFGQIMFDKCVDNPVVNTWLWESRLEVHYSTFSDKEAFMPGWGCGTPLPGRISHIVL